MQNYQQNVDQLLPNFLQNKEQFEPRIDQRFWSIIYTICFAFFDM